MDILTFLIFLLAYLSPPPVSMQQATHSRLHVRDAQDAHTVFEAVRQGRLRAVTRRLNDSERSMFVRSGSVFVWEECDDESGLKRWTDGRVWGQSRMREPYLFYDEKLPSDGFKSAEQQPKQPVFRFVDGPTRSSPGSSALLHQDRSGGHHTGLIKQAYSAFVILSPNSRPRKWHLTAYFTYADLPSIPTVDRDPLLSRITVPRGIYSSGKVRGRSDSDRSSGSPELSRSNSPPEPHMSVYRPPMDRARTLPSLHDSIGAYNFHGSNFNSLGSRLPEDHRVIQMLNSRHII
ncbi:hypothetical protein D9758_000743 [Tetrapyrgos nigripes]|uniref:Gti1/Pac2 family-domain-containing protein n=1 Tax=Tetrapyrgos nigripes TaxID=182062 RepID=A0A8H5LXJ1_9AGAR|nr:hypothetical protein D9758_000743 [Tetrapyrgos nigripes]